MKHLPSWVTHLRINQFFNLVGTNAIHGASKHIILLRINKGNLNKIILPKKLPPEVGKEPRCVNDLCQITTSKGRSYKEYTLETFLTEGSHVTETA